MDLKSDNELLKAVAEGGSLDYGIWPDLLSRLIPRLERIAQTEFPHTSSSHLPFSHPYTAPSQLSIKIEHPSHSDNPSSQTTVASSQLTDKENAPPNTQPSNTPLEEIPSESLSLPAIPLLNSIIQTLTTYFSQYPPHTVQRLCELILAPKTHYQTLPSYLHAVDRVVHVTSGANIYPLPAAIQDPKALPNGTNSGTDPNTVSWGTSVHTASSFGSDESLGGALLTPIPWLRTQIQSGADNIIDSSQLRKSEDELKTGDIEIVNGLNSASSMGTVSMSASGVPSALLLPNTVNDSPGGLRSEGGVTQGELLRQEQRAGVVPASQLSFAQGFGDANDVKHEDDEIPHARGPEEIGMEDMGPQAAGTVGVGMQGINVEAAVGRRSDEQEEKEVEAITATTPKREADEQLAGSSKRAKDEGKDKNRILTIEDRKSPQETIVGNVEKNNDIDAIDSSAV